MALEIKQEINKRLKIFNTANNLDKQLCDDLPDPLPCYSGFNFVISGASGSGKTTLLMSIMASRKKNGIRQSYRKLFDKILICSPTLGQGKSAKNDPFHDIPGDRKWKTFNNENMNEIYETLQSNREEEEHSVLILDDIGAQLRKSAGAEKQLVSLLQNRRHVFCSVFILVQRFRDLPPGIRNNMSHFVTFRPKNILEEESICSELLPFKKACWRQIMDYVFDNEDKFSFLMVDMSLKQTNKYRYFNKFDPLEISEKCD
jgi:nucleoside-triphosphatase THEP1